MSLYNMFTGFLFDAMPKWLKLNLDNYGNWFYS